MVYQLLKDIEQLLSGKESLTAAEQSILERSSKVITTMRNPEDTELLKTDELLIRYCPATKHPVLVYYDGDGMCSCLHNDTVEEDMEDVKRWLNEMTQEQTNSNMNYDKEEELMVLTPSKSKCRKCKSDMANRYAIFRAYTTKNLKPKTGKYHD